MVDNQNDFIDAFLNDYTIIQKPSIADLIAEVRKKIIEGWVPEGSFTVYQDAKGPRFCQTMLLYEEESGDDGLKEKITTRLKNVNRS